MNHLLIRLLEKFCKENEIDVQEIDSSLNYWENLDHLKSFVPSEVEDLAKVYAKTYRDWEKAVDIGDLYGIRRKETEEMPLILCNGYVWFDIRRTRVVRGYLKPFEKHVRIYTKAYAHTHTRCSYLIIKGHINVVLEICEVLSRNGIRSRLIGVNTEYMKDWSFLPKHGWIKNPS